jgi:hypothetical protein
VTGIDPYDPLLPVVWGIILVVLLAAGGWLLRKWLWSKRAEAAVSHLARQTRSAVATGVAPLAEWLNRYWPAEYEVRYLVAPCHTLCATLGGFPVAMHWKPAASRNHSHFLNVLFALELPADVPSPPIIESVPAACHAIARCRALGFVPRLTDAGMLAVAEPELLKTVSTAPSTLLHLTAVAAELHAMALALGGSPAR